jgi:hypothetical protein
MAVFEGEFGDSGFLIAADPDEGDFNIKPES